MHHQAVHKCRIFRRTPYHKQWLHRQALETQKQILGGWSSQTQHSGRNAEMLCTKHLQWFLFRELDIWCVYVYSSNQPFFSLNVVFTSGSWQDKIIQTNPILEAFGNAMTAWALICTKEIQMKKSDGSMEACVVPTPKGQEQQFFSLWQVDSWPDCLLVQSPIESKSRDVDVESRDDGYWLISVGINLSIICLFLVIVNPLPELLAEDICLDPTRQKERIEELKRYDMIRYDILWYDMIW